MKKRKLEFVTKDKVRERVEWLLKEIEGKALRYGARLEDGDYLHVEDIKDSIKKAFGDVME